MQACAPFIITSGYGDLATCKARLKLTCEKDIAAPGAGLDGAGCAAALATISCSDLFTNLPQICRPKGSKALAAACGVDLQCASGSCAKVGSSTCGKCATPAAENGDCSSAECGYGLTCVSGGTSKCVKSGVMGSPCSNSAPCGGLLACVEGTCGTPLAEGATCSSATFGGGCDLFKGTQCIGGKCTATSLGLAGEACGFINGAIAGCAGGANCSSQSAAGTCNVPLNDGAACVTPGPGCLPGAACTGGTCKIKDPSTCN